MGNTDSSPEVQEISTPIERDTNNRNTNNPILTRQVHPMQTVTLSRYSDFGSVETLQAHIPEFKPVNIVTQNTSSTSDSPLYTNMGPYTIPITNNSEMFYPIQTSTGKIALPMRRINSQGIPIIQYLIPQYDTDGSVQILDTGRINNGAFYQTVREPSGKIVKHIYHTSASINNRTTTSINTHTRTSRLSNTNSTSDNRATVMKKPTRTLRPDSSPTPPIYVSDEPVVPKMSPHQTKHTIERYSQGPPDPTLLDTADFLRQNSSLDFKVPPTAGSSDFLKSSPSQLDNNTSSNSLSSFMNTETQPPSYESISVVNKAQTEPLLSSRDPPKSNDQTYVHQPSKALQQHLKHHRIETHNPYDEL